MALAETSLGIMMREKMDWLGQRQRVLSQNIANVDTPKYRSKELAPIDFARALRRETRQLPLNMTNRSHIRSPHADNSFRQTRVREPYEVAPDGNTVVMEEQMMKVNDTASEYQLMSSIYKKYRSMYRIALGKQR